MRKSTFLTAGWYWQQARQGKERGGVGGQRQSAYKGALPGVSRKGPTPRNFCEVLGDPEQPPFSRTAQRREAGGPAR